NNLDFELLLQQRQRHEAYTSRLLERKFNIKSVSTKFNINTMTIYPNKASHIVEYFSNNENPEQRSVKQHEKRWKEAHKNIMYFFPNIENVNISEDFSLVKDNYIFVIYGNQLCVGKVIAVYFEAYNRHCYIDEAVMNLNDISYISLQVYMPIYRDLFSDTTMEGYNILTHYLASNIIYHIGAAGVLIENNILKLVEKEKQYFNYFNQKEIIKIIVEQI
ncbi:24789_t:CDS:2, partial [Gigaspora rosea]